MLARFYQQFDADLTRDVPAEAYGGWRTEEIEIDRDRTALVVMHAWDMGTPDRYPGWWRAVEYAPRAKAICEDIFPELLGSARASSQRLYHVISGREPVDDLPGHRRAKSLAGPPPECRRLDLDGPDPVMQRLNEQRGERVFVGRHNERDVSAGFDALDFHPSARPLGDEGVAATAHELLALCQADGVNHLVYVGFAINWCLLASPGGMVDMSRRGLMCSTIAEATTAVENRETAREELCKQIALWRVALAFGFVFGVDDFLAAMAAPMP